jgi:bifunctional DNA-binding transcriptional regulator/antitoxin component of YhaV-PrlF toxin-antitoxin module
LYNRGTSKKGGEKMEVLETKTKRLLVDKGSLAIGIPKNFRKHLNLDLTSEYTVSAMSDGSIIIKKKEVENEA